MEESLSKLRHTLTPSFEILDMFECAQLSPTDLILVPHGSIETPLATAVAIANVISHFLLLYSLILHLFSSSAAPHHGNTLTCYC